jgi:hypothetical protein
VLVTGVPTPRHHVSGWLEQPADINAIVGGLLRDLAFAQPTQPQMFGYKRAAAAILALEQPLTEMIKETGALPKIAGIGPGSAGVIAEVLESGHSSTVERAIDLSGRQPTSNVVARFDSAF